VFPATRKTRSPRGGARFSSCNGGPPASCSADGAGKPKAPRSTGTSLAGCRRTTALPPGGLGGGRGRSGHRCLTRTGFHEVWGKMKPALFFCLFFFFFPHSPFSVLGGNVAIRPAPGYGRPWLALHPEGPGVFVVDLYILQTKPASSPEKIIQLRRSFPERLEFPAGGSCY